MKLPSLTRSQARLPAERQESEIQDMQPGDSGWTVPWGMYAGKNGALWLNGNYSLHETPGGTVKMRVWRDESDGYWRVDCSGCRDYRWSREGGGYCGSFKPIPVADAKF